jgi:hypothetical protein
VRWEKLLKIFGYSMFNYSEFCGMNIINSIVKKFKIRAYSSDEIFIKKEGNQ